MKQAKADAQELVEAYRAEKQQEFNNMVLAAGKLETRQNRYMFAFFGSIFHSIILLFNKIKYLNCFCHNT